MVSNSFRLERADRSRLCRRSWRGGLWAGPAGRLNHVEWFGIDPEHHEKLLWNFYQRNDLIRDGLGSVLVLG